MVQTLGPLTQSNAPLFNIAIYRLT